MYYVYFKMNEKREAKIAVVPIQMIQNGDIHFDSIQEFEGKPVVHRENSLRESTNVLMYNDLNDLVLRKINNRLSFLRTTSMDIDVFNELVQREGFDKDSFFKYSSEFFELHPFTTLADHVFFDTGEVFEERRLSVSVPSASMGLNPEQPMYFSHSVQIDFTTAMFNDGIVVPTLDIIPELLSLLTTISHSDSVPKPLPSHKTRDVGDWSFTWSFLNSVLISVASGKHFLDATVPGFEVSGETMANFPGLLESYTAAKEAFQRGGSIRVSFRNIPFNSPELDGSVESHAYSRHAYEAYTLQSDDRLHYKGTIHVEVVDEEPVEGSYMTEITPDAIYYSFSGVYQGNTIDSAMMQFFYEFAEVIYRKDVLYEYCQSNSETSLLDGRPIIDFSFDDLDLTRIPS